MFSKLGRKSLVMSAALTLMITSTGASFAGPTSVIKVINNWSEDATVASNTECVGSVDPAFSTINGGSQKNFSVDASFDSIFSCRVVYRKGNAGRRCDFVISRLTNFSLGSLSWKYPQVVVYEDSGVDCSYTFTSVQDTGDAPNGTNGDFNLTLEMD